MIPMRNRKKTLEVTMEEMRNFSFAYIEKYAPSKQQLRTYLLKKYLKANVPNIKKQDITNLIDIVLVDLEKSKFISDKFYSESKSRSLIQRGSSINKIRNYLIGKGINDIYIKETLEKIKEDNSDQDFFSAIKICKKKRIGPARAEDNRSLFYKKDISLLARNGFDFETSKRIMDIDKDDYIKIIKLLYFLFFFSKIINFISDVVFYEDKN
jgi:regulatory protein